MRELIANSSNISFFPATDLTCVKYFCVICVGDNNVWEQCSRNNDSLQNM